MACFNFIVLNQIFLTFVFTLYIFFLGELSFTVFDHLSTRDFNFWIVFEWAHSFHRHQYFVCHVWQFSVFITLALNFFYRSFKYFYFKIICLLFIYRSDKYSSSLFVVSLQYFKKQISLRYSILKFVWLNQQLQLKLLSGLEGKW